MKQCILVPSSLRGHDASPVVEGQVATHANGHLEHVALHRLGKPPVQLRDAGQPLEVCRTAPPWLASGPVVDPSEGEQHSAEAVVPVGGVAPANASEASARPQSASYPSRPTSLSPTIVASSWATVG